MIELPQSKPFSSMPYGFARLWRCLLCAYPAEFREEYGPHLTQDFVDRYQEETGVSRYQLCFATVLDVLLTGAKERYYTMMTDLKHSARRLLAQPLLATVAVLSLALGIGANSAVFSIVNDVILSPGRYSDMDRRVIMHTADSGAKLVPTSTPADFADWRAQSRTLHDWQLFSYGIPTTASLAGEPERIRWQQVTPGLLDSLGVKPVLGRWFREGEIDERPCLISEAYWQRRFGGTADVIGKKLRMGQGAYTIIGVVPMDFRLALNRSEIDFWSLMDLRPGSTGMQRRAAWFGAIAKIEPEFTVPQAQAEMNGINANLAATYPETNAKRTVAVRPFIEALRWGHETTGATFFGAVTLILLIACANVANLLLARAAMRRREISVRSALGADRRRLIRQFMADGLVLAVPAVAIGLALGYGALAQFRLLAPKDFPGAATAEVNAVVLGFTVVAGVLASVFAALFPAFQASKVDLTEALKEGGRSSAGRRTLRLRSLLVAGEIALTLVLLTGAGLLLGTLWRVGNHSLGFNPKNVTVAAVGLGGSRYGSTAPERGPDTWRVKAPVAQFNDHVLTQLRSLPGVENAALTSRVPMGPGGARFPARIRIQGAAVEDGTLPAVQPVVVSSGYFETMQIPLRRGRLLSDRDRENTPWVAIVNESLARELFPGGEAVGQVVTLQPSGVATPDEQPREIVGVIADYTPSNPQEPVPPSIYTTYLQQPEIVPGGSQSNRYAPKFVIRTRAGSVIAEEAVRRIIHTFDAALPLGTYGSLEELLLTRSAPIRFYAYSLVLFAAIAITLAGVGIYGLMNYAVADRVHEIGIRMSLGASRRQVLGMVVGQGLRIAAAGIVVGLAGALATTGLLRQFLFEIEPSDPLTYALAATLVLTISVVSCGLPAWRATRVNPVVALRRE